MVVGISGASGAIYGIRLVLMVRETPLHAGHLRSMLAVTEAGGIICPPVPAFYNDPTSLSDMVDHTLGRMLDLFGSMRPACAAGACKRQPPAILQAIIKKILLIYKINLLLRGLLLL
jgi:3-polyprenyl-4-hydroxybenzoate decarboxylase